MKDSDNFYCNQKFTWLSVDLEKKLTYSCCTAAPAKIDLQWLEKNPGRIFNTPFMQQERQLMLENKPVSSCELACWQPEKQNKVSRRLRSNSLDRTHISIESEPTTLNIILGSDCNLTCVYCCKQYSSAWARDIKLNGSYLDKDRFQFTKIDQILEKISQKEHSKANSTKILHEEIAAIDSVDQIMVTGGEPFLYNGLFDLVNSISNTVKIRLYSGLGVNQTRFAAQLDKLKNLSNIVIVISAENLDKFYEFNRFGNSYQNFLTNLELLEANNWCVEFASTVSNLTLYGLVDFSKQFESKNIYYDMCYDPDFLSVNVLDPLSKEKLIRDIESSTIPIRNQIIQTIMADYTPEQKNNFGLYVKEFARRRNLSLDIYPASLLNWINNVV